MNLNPGDRILVCRTDRLGDLLLALPLVESLKMRYPECGVDVLASLYASPILENNPRIDSIVRVQYDQLVTVRHYRKELQQKIEKAGYSVAIVLFPERHIARLIHRANIPNRIGTAGRFHSVFFNHRLFHSRRQNRKHEFEYNLDFLQFFDDGDTSVLPKVFPTDKELRNARRILGDSGIGDQFVVLHPGSGGSAHRWETSRFHELYRRLTDEGFDVIISGSDAEAATYAKWVDSSGEAVRSIAGQTDLRTLAAVLSEATAVVANSTGPLHLAAAAGTRVVGLYPRQKVMSPVRWGPCGTGHRVIQPASPECDCPPKDCRCMSTISVDAAHQAVLEIMSQEKPEV
jgi:lipopolysaccharide heptosyltransferase II